MLLLQDLKSLVNTCEIPVVLLALFVTKIIYALASGGQLEGKNGFLYSAAGRKVDTETLLAHKPVCFFATYCLYSEFSMYA